MLVNIKSGFVLGVDLRRKGVRLFPLSFLCSINSQLCQKRIQSFLLQSFLLFSKNFVLGVLAKGIFQPISIISIRETYPISCQKFNFFPKFPLIFYLYFKLTGSQLQSKFKSYKNLNLLSNVCNSSSEWVILLHIWKVLPPVAHSTAGEAGSCSFSIIGGNGRTNYRVKHKAKRC